MNTAPQKHRVVLITGASGGIGEACAQAFATAGWQVLAASRDVGRIAAASNIRPLQLDPASATDRTALLGLINAEYGGRLDALVNNAGYSQSGPVELLDAAQWRTQLDTNVIEPALLSAALLPALRLAEGCIINMSSVLGRVGYAWQGAYCASKFALEGWSESLLLETHTQGVRVHLIEPGSTTSKFGHHMQGAAELRPPYAASAERFARLRAKLAQGAQPRERVAAAVLRVAERKCASFRVVVGNDARAAIWLSRFLPARVYLSMIRLLTRKLLGLRRDAT